MSLGLGRFHARLVSGLFGAACLTALVGCPNPNTYGTPRTVEPGKVSFTVAAEWEGYRFKEQETTTNGGNTQTVTASQSGSVVVPPTFLVRVGAADRLDFGFRANNMSSLGADMKYNFVKSKFFDAAIDPGFQWFNVGVNVVHLHLPLLLAVNASKAVSIVLTPGIIYGTSSNNTVDNDLQRAFGTTGLIGRAGIGLDLRFTPKFAVHPEVTFMRAFARDTTLNTDATMTYMFGIGFNFGHLPSYADTEDTEAAPAAAPAPAQ